MDALGFQRRKGRGRKKKLKRLIRPQMDEPTTFTRRKRRARKEKMAGRPDYRL
jgi:hypothetical protein